MMAISLSQPSAVENGFSQDAHKRLHRIGQDSDSAHHILGHDCLGCDCQTGQNEKIITLVLGYSYWSIIGDPVSHDIGRSSA
jgi:hypothetical protein